jgi:hypothetical protein
VLRAARNWTSTDLDGVSVVLINVELDLPDWEGIRRELDRKFPRQVPRVR